MAHTIHEFPVRRPGFITQADWIGPDNQLQLRIRYLDASDTLREIRFDTRHLADNVQGDICLPNSNDLANLGPKYENILRSHVRMTCMVARTGIPGSSEFNDALMNGVSSNLNTALGVVKVVDITAIDDATTRLTFRQGSGPTLDMDFSYAELNNYSFEPETQLYVVPGSVKKQFATYVHDYPNTILSQSRRDEIAEYVLSLEPWI